MATIKLSSTKSASKLINYAKNKAEITKGINCNENTVKQEFEATRNIYNKNDKIQAHHIIQSFKPNEITPEKANLVGLELAKKIAKDYEVLVCTHTDQKHIHNHLVINSVNFETGRKFQAHGMQAIKKTRALSDEICIKHDLSIVQKKEQKQEINYTLAEQEILKKGGISWKEELRQAIEFEKINSKDFESFSKNLKENYDIETKLRGETLSYLHPEKERFIRANKLGEDYNIGELKNEFNREIKQEQQGTTGINKPTERNERIKQNNEKLSIRSDGQRDIEEVNNLGRDRSDKQNIADNTKRNTEDFAELTKLTRTMEKELQECNRERNSRTRELSQRHERTLSRNRESYEREFEHD